MSGDGKHFYLCEAMAGTDNIVYQFDLASPWDISTDPAYNSKNFDFYNEIDQLGEGVEIYALTFSDDGTKAFVAGSFTHGVHQYSLSTAWDISTCSYDSLVFDYKTEVVGGSYLLSYGFNVFGDKAYATAFKIFSPNLRTFQYSVQVGSSNGGGDLIWRAGHQNEGDSRARVVVDNSEIPTDTDFTILCDVRCESGQPGRVRIWIDGVLKGTDDTGAGTQKFNGNGWSSGDNGRVNGYTDHRHHFSGEIIGPESGFYHQPLTNSGVTFESELRYWHGELVNAPLGDALWSGGNSNKLYANSGLFSSTIKDSQDVSNHDNANTGVSWDGENVLWCGDETNKLFLMSGRFSRTVKTSVDVGGINDTPTGISTFDIVGRLGSGELSIHTGAVKSGILKPLAMSGAGRFFERSIPPTGEKIYITDYAATSSDALITRMNIDGSNHETILTGPGDARDIVTDMGAQKMFWAEVSQNSVGTQTGAVHDAIFCANLDGSGYTELADVMANRRSDETSASVVGLAIDKVNQRVLFMTRAVLSTPQSSPNGGTYPVRINLLEVNYDGTSNGQSGPSYFKIGNPLLRVSSQDPGRDDEMIPARMKYVEPSEGYPAGRLFYLTRTRTEAEDPGYDIGFPRDRYGSEVLYIDLHTDSSTTCYQHADNIRSFDVDAQNNRLYLGRHSYHPISTVFGDINAVPRPFVDFPGWGEEPSAEFTGIRSPESRLERIDYADNSFDQSKAILNFVHKDSYLLQDYGGIGTGAVRVANFGKVPSASGNVSNQQFMGQVDSAFQEWKDLFEQEFPGLTLNFQNLGIEVGVPPKMDYAGPDAPVFDTLSGQFVYDIPNGTYHGFSYDKVGDMRVAMHKFSPRNLVGGNVLAHAYYPQNLLDTLGSRGSFAGDLHFDVDDDWRLDIEPTGGSASPFSILYVAAHEIGHNLGFRHDNDVSSLMAPFVKASYARDIGNLRDSPADILAVQFLYGSDNQTPTNGSTQQLPAQNQWPPLRNAIKRLQNGQSTSEVVTFTYSYMQARPKWVIEADAGGFKRAPIISLASDVWKVPSDITLDLEDEFIYVSDYSAGQILRFELDGSNRTELTQLNSGEFSGLALVLAESNIYVGEGDLETKPVEASGDVKYSSPFAGSGDLEISKVSLNGIVSHQNSPHLPKLTVAGIGSFKFVGIAKASKTTLLNLSVSGQGTHTNPGSYIRPTDDIYYRNRNDGLVPRHGWNQLGFDNKYDTTVTCPRTQHVKSPSTPTDLVVNDGCNLDKDENIIVDMPVRNINITIDNTLSPNASKVAKSVALMNQLNSQGLNTGKKNKFRRKKK